MNWSAVEPVLSPAAAAQRQFPPGPETQSQASVAEEEAGEEGPREESRAGQWRDGRDGSQEESRRTDHEDHE